MGLMIISFVIIGLTLSAWLMNQCQMKEIESFVAAKKNVKIQVGTLPGSTPEMAEIMKKLNETGNQLVADSAYDNVDRSFL